MSETPPRAWRRPPRGFRSVSSAGNTSTGVEKTLGRSVAEHSFRKHLHGRGEDAYICQSTATPGETPPRAWRRPSPESLYRLQPRNTSTGVEKTGNTDPALTEPEKHLHGRGEDRRFVLSARQCVETPPRAWRRQFPRYSVYRWIGNTSTGVEKTTLFTWRFSSDRKHLHGRGEDPFQRR